MASKMPSLQKILEKYLKSDMKPDKRSSFNKYKATHTADRSAEYSQGIREAYIASRLGDRGRIGSEKAYSSGYLGSGYSSYLDDTREDDLAERLDVVSDRMALDERSKYNGYLSYLNEYESRQRTLSEEVSKSLVKSNVADPRAAYNYAISKGLEEEAAKTVSYAVYELMRGKVITSIVDKLVDLKMSESTAVTLAKSYGLIDEDVEYIRKLARESHENRGFYYAGIEAEAPHLYKELFGSNEELSDYLKKLENFADKLHPQE